MLNAPSTKRPHTLHQCRDAHEFLVKFRDEAGVSVDDLIARLAFPEGVVACILGGSIPLRLATERSDVDLMVLVDDVAALRPLPSDRGQQLDGEWFGETDNLAIRETVAVEQGIEVNIEFVLTSRIEEFARRLSQAGLWMSFSGHNVQILTRLKTGWVLSTCEAFDACASLLKDESLEIHAAVRYLVLALQNLEDAYAAVSDNLGVALYLGRGCVDACFSAFLAHEGCAFVGSKWLRLLDGGETPRKRSIQQTLGPLAATGRSLLFPPLLVERHAVCHYLAEVGDFFVSIKKAIERDTAFRVAFKLCPQLADPSFAVTQTSRGGSGDT